MTFNIDFNRKNDDMFLVEVLGAVSVPTHSTKYPPFEKLVVELSSLEELRELVQITNKESGKFYFAVIDFGDSPSDTPCLYLDDRG